LGDLPLLFNGALYASARTEHHIPLGLPELARYRGEVVRCLIRPGDRDVGMLGSCVDGAQSWLGVRVNTCFFIWRRWRWQATKIQKWNLLWKAGWTWNLSCRANDASLFHLPGQSRS